MTVSTLNPQETQMSVPSILTQAAKYRSFGPNYDRNVDTSAAFLEKLYNEAPNSKQIALLFEELKTRLDRKAN